MPKASAPNAPCVAVWLSPQTMVMPGRRQALLRPDDVHDALADVDHGEIGHAELGDVLLQRLDLDARLLVRCRGCGRVVGMLWSATAMVASGRRTWRPAMRRPSKACGLVTSWTRWRSM